MHNVPMFVYTDQVKHHGGYSIYLIALLLPITAGNGASKAGKNCVTACMYILYNKCSSIFFTIYPPATEVPPIIMFFIDIFINLLSNTSSPLSWQTLLRKRKLCLIRIKSLRIQRI